MPDTSVETARVSAPGAPRPVTPTTILAAGLADVAHRLTAGVAPDADLLAELDRLVTLAAGLDPYLAHHTTAESPALAELARRTADEDWNGPSGNGVVEQEMVSGHVEGQFLKTLVHLARATDVLEIGMFTGYSALAMAEAVPAHGRVVACELDPDVAAFASRCLGASADGAKVDVRVGPAIDTLAELAAGDEQFDLVFLDADKTGYGDYLAAVLDGDLLTAHGVVVVDNTLMQGQPWSAVNRTVNGDAIAVFNEMVAADPRVEQVVLPLRDGLTLIRRVDGS